MLQYRTLPAAAAPAPANPIFGIPLGPDTSGNFAWTVNGLAVLTPAGRFVRKDDVGAFLVDLTPLIVPVSPQVYFLPAVTVGPGDLLVTASGAAFSALYVVSASTPDNILAIDTATSIVVRYATPANLFLNFYVKAVSLLDIALGIGLNTQGVSL